MNERDEEKLQELVKTLKKIVQLYYPIEMTIVGASIFPHGALVLDPSRNVPESAKQLHYALLEASSIIKEYSIDTVVLLTPHGIAQEKDFSVYLNQAFEGTAEWEGEYLEYKVSVKNDLDSANMLLDAFRKNKASVSGLITFTQSAIAPLRWGEVIPLWFLEPMQYQGVIISNPYRRYTELEKMVPELKKIGEVLYDTLQATDKNYYLLVSGDLAHTHQDSENYKYSETAELFDKAIEEWVVTMNEEVLLKEAMKYHETALTCGYANIIILNSFLKKGAFTSKLFKRAHPTYYGMLVAMFYPNKES